MRRKRYGLRILGLDYGEKRIGVAVCDELGMTAQGLSTIIRKNKQHDRDILGRLIHDYKVEKIVIGYPVRLDGSEGIQCEKVNRFALLMEKTFALPVMKWQETLSTKEAEEILINAGVRWEKRKKMVDKLAACLILQNYLDSIVQK
ncbi:MAG: Holliday junction resolvase RuvX [Smithella sp.]